MNVTQYKRRILNTSQIETLDFTVHQGANMHGSAGVPRERALELVNQWNAAPHLYMQAARYAYWIDR